MQKSQHSKPLQDNNRQQTLGGDYIWIQQFIREIIFYSLRQEYVGEEVSSDGQQGDGHG